MIAWRLRLIAVRVNTKTSGSILDYLPDFDLEELIISYIQIKNDLYVLSNSIANRSTTPLIECEFMSRDIKNPVRAVVQVKGKKGKIDVSAYKSYLDDGLIVYLFSDNYQNRINDSRCVYIDKADVLSFYQEYKSVLPYSITQWENLFK